MTQAMLLELERRRHARKNQDVELCSIRLDPDGGDVVDTLHMVDISKSGIGAKADRAFYPGQRIVVSLPMPCDGGLKNIYATIVQCRQCEGGYRVGLEFDTVSVGAWCGVAGAIAAA
ncbi:MAG: PilZ domain-containing protein [Phycisphaerae bacterium]|nr:PilZ domain-containing protein [Phycisphaerae bacterium]